MVIPIFLITFTPSNPLTILRVIEKTKKTRQYLEHKEITRLLINLFILFRAGYWDSFSHPGQLLHRSTHRVCVLLLSSTCKLLLNPTTVISPVGCAICAFCLWNR